MNWGSPEEGFGPDRDPSGRKAAASVAALPSALVVERFRMDPSKTYARRARRNPTAPWHAPRESRR